jgi:hypothetical protein
MKINVNGLEIETERYTEESVPVEKNNREWISVNDKLPPDLHEVLYFATTNEGNTREIMTGHRENGFWKHCCMFYSSQTLNHLVKVTHWMELPDYPKPPTVAEAAKIGHEHAQEFAKKFVDTNKELLKRLPDR